MALVDRKVTRLTVLLHIIMLRTAASKVKFAVWHMSLAATSPTFTWMTRVNSRVWLPYMIAL